eukprot:2381547-Alexandrium_andersonii.AAC.1
MHIIQRTCMQVECSHRLPAVMHPVEAETTDPAQTTLCKWTRIQVSLEIMQHAAAKAIRVAHLRTDKAGLVDKRVGMAANAHGGG